MEVVVDENVLPVVVVGAGPIGLAAAAHLLDRGLKPLVLEAGPAAGASVRQWHHVRLFSRWGELVDPAAEKLLAPTGCDDRRPCRCALPRVSREIVTEMVGTTRSRVNIFIGRFKKFGLIEETPACSKAVLHSRALPTAAWSCLKQNIRRAGAEGIVHAGVRHHKRKVHREIHHCGNFSVDHGAHAFAGRGQ